MDDLLIKMVVIGLSIFVVMYIFSNFGSYVNFVEGMQTNTPAQTTEQDGIAGNSSKYGSNIKAQTIKLQDTLLVSKYRAEYENAIINLDDYVNNLMLQTALSIKQSNPVEGFEKLTKLSNAKVALNSVMKFIDST